MFLIGFVVGFGMICGGSVLFGYGIDGVGAFIGSFAVAATTATIAANN
jgi:hypothetical protein